MTDTEYLARHGVTREHEAAFGPRVEPHEQTAGDLPGLHRYGELAGLFADQFAAFVSGQWRRLRGAARPPADLAEDADVSAAVLACAMRRWPRPDVRRMLLPAAVAFVAAERLLGREDVAEAWATGWYRRGLPPTDARLGRRRELAAVGDDHFEQLLAESVAIADGSPGRPTTDFISPAAVLAMARQGERPRRGFRKVTLLFHPVAGQFGSPEQAAELFDTIDQGLTADDPARAVATMDTSEAAFAALERTPGLWGHGELRRRAAESYVRWERRLGQLGVPVGDDPDEPERGDHRAALAGLTDGQFGAAVESLGNSPRDDWPPPRKKLAGEVLGPAGG